MKKILTTIAILFSLIASSQDSVKVTITPQARDCEFIGSFAFNNTKLEELYDSIKVKFRVANPPTGNTTVSITGYTIDWVNLMELLKNNSVSLKSNTTSRVETLLRAVAQTYLTGKLDAFDTADGDLFSSFRQFGRSKIRRQ